MTQNFSFSWSIFRLFSQSFHLAIQVCPAPEAEVDDAAQFVSHFVFLRVGFRFGLVSANVLCRKVLELLLDLG